MQVVSYRLTTFDPTNPYIAENDDSQVATMIATEDVNSDGDPIFRAKVRINIWIEGWDADAFNSILNDRIKIQLKFKAAKSSSE